MDAQDYLDAQRRNRILNPEKKATPAEMAVEWFLDEDSGFKEIQNRIEILDAAKGNPEAEDRVFGAKAFYSNTFKKHMEDMERGTSEEVPADVAIKARELEKDLLRAIREASNGTIH